MNMKKKINNNNKKLQNSKYILKSQKSFNSKMIKKIKLQKKTIVKSVIILVI